MKVQVKNLKIKDSKRITHLVAAVKAIRAVTGWSLKQSVDFVKEGTLNLYSEHLEVEATPDILEMFDIAGEPADNRAVSLHLKAASIAAIEAGMYGTAIEVLQTLKNL